MTTSPRSGANRSGPSKPSAAASRAKTLASPEKARASLALDLVSGANMRGSFASFDPISSLWRTSQRSLFEDLEPSWVTWPRSGMMRGGTASQLPPLAPLTGATVSGLLPTPTAVCYKGLYRNIAKMMEKIPEHQIRYVHFLQSHNLSDGEIIEEYEKLMGLPTKYTDLKCSETAKCLLARMSLEK